MTNIDRNLFKAINRFADRTSWAHGIVRLYAKDGIVLFAALLVAAWWSGRTSTMPVRSVAKAVWVGAGALLALVINQPLGSVIGRARPYTTISNVHLLVDKTKDFSFPSDHATVAGAVAAGLFLVNRRLGLIAIIAALAMAFARVYVGAHYPSDIAAGLVFGACMTAAFSRFGPLVIEPPLRVLLKTPLRKLVTAETAEPRFS
jgi:membrane-associated phospholipid phosphatase